MEYKKLSYGSSVNVLFELELNGYEDILIQVLKLSKDTFNVPEQIVSEVLVLKLSVFITSENVNVMLSVINTLLLLSDIVETEVTVGAVVSGVGVAMEVLSPSVEVLS